MQRIKLLICIVLCVAVLCGCEKLSAKEQETVPTEGKETSLGIKKQEDLEEVQTGVEEEALEEALTEAEADAPEAAEVIVPEETNADFESYIFKVENPWVEIYAGPGYQYGACGEIKDQGSYTIVEESVESFAGGNSVTWGRLKSDAGWICLEDAKLKPEGGPPYRCTECGRADVSVSRDALCADCDGETSDAGEVCDNCGADCSSRGSIDGLCQDCYHTIQEEFEDLLDLF